MKFTIPCFVRVEDADERQKLLQWCLSLGYLCPEIPQEERLGELVICDGKCVGIAHNPATFSVEATYYDCSTDIELFKALAAMNYNNDYMQWFTDGIDWRLCPDVVVTKKVIPSYALYKKATAEEVVEHFKNRK